MSNSNDIELRASLEDYLKVIIILSEHTHYALSATKR